MKKLLTVMLALVLCFGLAACGSEKASNKKEEVKIEKTIDSIAKELDLKDASFSAFQMIDAKDGKKFEKQMVEVYIFENHAKAEQAVKEMSEIVNFKAVINDTVVLFVDAEYDGSQLIEKFKNLKFK